MTVLTPNQLTEATKLEQPAAQVRLLTEWGVPFRVRRDGTVMTTQNAIDHALIESMNTRPNLQAIRRKA